MDNIVKPLTPKEVAANRTIHPGVIEAVNELLKKHFKGKSATIKQKEIIAEFKKKHPRYNTQKLFDNGDMDFEDVFRQAGWKVVYDKPGYNENHYDAYFTFTPNN